MVLQFIMTLEEEANMGVRVVPRLFCHDCFTEEVNGTAFGGSSSSDGGSGDPPPFHAHGADPAKSAFAKYAHPFMNNPKFVEMLSKYKVDVNHRTAEAQSGEVLAATGTPVPGLGTPTDAGASAKEGFTALHVATVSCFYSKIYYYPTTHYPAGSYSTR